MTIEEVRAKIDQARINKDKRYLNMFLNIGLRSKERSLEYIQDISGCDREVAEQYYNQRVEEDEKTVAETPQKQVYIPKCPTCGSPSIKKITGSKRWLTTGLFGIGSSDMGKTLECNNCGYKW